MSFFDKTTLSDRFSREAMPFVEHPSRYIGAELNSVHKGPGVDVRLALAFPDLYDLGLGNLGLMILYSILNELPWCWAERAYAPALDMEKILRERGLPLFTHESKTALKELDGIGFTLQSELTYTNILNMLDLAGISVHSKDRGEDEPLIFAGGPCVFNPEPLADFIDFFVIGDGEEAVVEIAEAFRGLKGRCRAEKLEAFSKIEGVYAPALYPFEVLEGGRLVPVLDAAPICRRVTPDLDAVNYPTKLIVPFFPQVHDRAGLEVMRGCTHGCRFCQAGMTGRPVRERGLDTIDSLMRRTAKDTGYEETSLVSLSTCDYSRAGALVSQAAETAAGMDMSVSLPSLRLDTFAVDLADKISGIRRSGLTFAPEAASPRLRAVINKWIPDEALFETAEEVFRKGWNHLKLYFMIGLPTETDDDVEAIVELCAKTLERARRVNRGANIHTGISTFIPKPFTPFQWAEQIGFDESRRRQELLYQGFSKCRGIRYGRHNPRLTFIEGLITRSDRRVGALIEQAWRNGARFDAWDEWRDFSAWEQAIDDTGFDAGDALRVRGLEERMPWDHLDTFVSKNWLRADWNRALELAHEPDCRMGQCKACGVNQHVPDLCSEMVTRSLQAEVERRMQPEPDEGREEIPANKFPERNEPEPVQRIRFRIGRKGETRFLSNREFMTAWARALRRAGFPLSYSQGFHAHPKISFSTAPPVGEESEGDYMDIVLRAPVKLPQALERLRDVLPMGLEVYEAEEVELRSPSLMSLVQGYSYFIRTDTDAAEIKSRVDAALSSGCLEVERRTKKSKKKRGPMKFTKVNVRPMIKYISVSEDAGETLLEVELGIFELKSIKVRELLSLLGLDISCARVFKRATHLADEKNKGRPC